MDTKITLDSCWYDPSEREKYIKKIKEQYDIDCEFNDGSDYYSSWTYTGSKENIKKFLEKDYMPCFDEDDYCDEVLEFLANFS